MRRREFITLVGGSGGVAACCARAAGGRSCRPSGSWVRGTSSAQSPWTAAFDAAAARTRLDRGPHHRDRVSLGGGTQRALAEIAAEFVRLKVDVIVTTAAAPVLAAKQATSVIPIVFARGGGPGWQRPRREPGATGRQRHGPVDPVSRSRRQASRTFARGCPQSPPIGDHGQCRRSRRRPGDARGSGSGPHARPRGRHDRNPTSRRISRPPSRRSRAGRTHFMSYRPARKHQSDSHQHLGAGRATADDLRPSGSTSKREV